MKLTYELDGVVPVIESIYYGMGHSAKNSLEVVNRKGTGLG